MSPRPLCVPLLSLAACLMIAAGSAHANRYALVDLGPAKYPSQVNDRDEIAGSGRNDHAMLWRDGRWRKLAESISHGEAINADGDVAGDDGDHPVLWQRHEPARTLPLPRDAFFGLGFGINDARTVVGVFYDGQHIGCFQWTDEAGAIDLGFMADGDYCEATAINRRGQVTGESSTTPGGPVHAFRYQDGQFEDLGVLSQDGSSEGLSINRRGDVAGLASVLDEMHYHAVVWRGSQLVDLDPDSAIHKSVATGINDRGDIVGTIQIDDQFTQRAVRFTDHGIVRLDDEVRDLRHWHVIQAQGVNQRGDIVGVALGPNGHAHGVLLELESLD